MQTLVDGAGLSAPSTRRPVVNSPFQRTPTGYPRLEEVTMLFCLFPYLILGAAIVFLVQKVLGKNDNHWFG